MVTLENINALTQTAAGITLHEMTYYEVQSCTLLLCPPKYCNYCCCNVIYLESGIVHVLLVMLPNEIPKNGLFYTCSLYLNIFRVEEA